MFRVYLKMKQNKAVFNIVHYTWHQVLSEHCGSFVLFSVKSSTALSLLVLFVNLEERQRRKQTT